jgi:glycerol-3-phosphate cytidylyltransferase
MVRKQRIVLIQGAFEILNYGHIRAFKFAKAQGDYLIVALNTNELIADYKSRQAVMPWVQKKRIIESIRYVDKVVPAKEFSPLRLLKQHHVDVYVLTREWEHTKAVEMAFMKDKGGRVCFSRRFKGVSTTAVKEKLLREYLDEQQNPAYREARAWGFPSAGENLGGVIREHSQQNNGVSIQGGQS